MNLNIVLFEDEHTKEMSPVALARPAFAVNCGVYNLYEVAGFIADHVSYCVRDYLAGMTEENFPQSATPGARWLFLNASVMPDIGYVDELRELVSAGEPFLATCDQRVAAALLPEDQDMPEELSADTVTPFLLNLQLPVLDGEPFETLDYPFDAVAAIEKVFERNIEHKIENGDYGELRPEVYLGDGAQVSDSAVFDTSEGPIVLDDGVDVDHFTYFEGPVYVGPDSRIIERASVKERVSIGHTCKIGGEVEQSVIEDYTNKQHHGFLGHSHVGSWVNLGAGTSNSDLKNTYGEVRIMHRGRRLETGMRFLGAMIGDYAKSAINTSIFTGKTVGVCSMLYGCVGQNVPSFCNYARTFGQVSEVPAEQAVITQRRMFARRDVKQTEKDVELMKALFQRTRAERRISDEPPTF